MAVIRFCLLKAMSKRIFLSFACLSMLGVASLSPIFVSASANASVMLAQASSSQKAVADRLNQEGLQALRTSQYPIALEKFQTALNIYQQIGDRSVLKVRRTRSKKLQEQSHCLCLKR